MKTFWIRTASATIYAILFIGSIYSGRLLGNSNWGIVILTAFSLFVALGCTFEYFRIAEMQGHHPNKPLGYFFPTAMILMISLLPMDRTDLGVGNIIALVLGAVLFISLPITLAAQLWRSSDQPFNDVLHTLLPTFYCALPLGLMSTLHYVYNILMICIVMVWVNDCFAYLGGSLVGRHKMWPRHSPGKSWEGTAIGVVAAVSVGILVGPLFDTCVDSASHPRIVWAFLGLVCGIIGTLGDLVESMLKRSVALKDSGKIMPGHGGFLDRFDSLLMIIPIATLVGLVLY